MDSEYEQDYDEDFSGWPEVEGWESQPVDDDYDPTYGWMDEGDVYDHCPDITCREDILADSRFRHLWDELAPTARVWWADARDMDLARWKLEQYGDELQYWCIGAKTTECGKVYLSVLAYFREETYLPEEQGWMRVSNDFRDVKEEAARMKEHGEWIESGTLYLSKSRKRVFDDMN